MARRSWQEQEAETDHGDPCNRGDWCSGRTVTVENGIRTVTPASTSRAYCDGCSTHIGKCLDELPALYGRLAREIGEARQAEILIKIPFGPSLPFSEAIDAHMRAMTETMFSWEERTRLVAHLSDLRAEVTERPQDRLADLERSVDIISPRLSVFLGLGRGEMIRVIPRKAIESYTADEDAIILHVNRDAGTMTLLARLGGVQAGEEVMHLHYIARRLLLETSPPLPLLPDFRCRSCERKALRQAPPPWHEDSAWMFSRCDACGDEMDRSEYDLNAKRWIAWEKAHLSTPVLAGLGAA